MRQCSPKPYRIIFMISVISFYKQISVLTCLNTRFVNLITAPCETSRSINFCISYLQQIPFDQKLYSYSAYLISSNSRHDVLRLKKNIAKIHRLRIFIASCQALIFQQFCIKIIRLQNPHGVCSHAGCISTRKSYKCSLS